VLTANGNIEVGTVALDQVLAIVLDNDYCRAVGDVDEFDLRINGQAMVVRV
jgi:hypothetical protein